MTGYKDDSEDIQHQIGVCYVSKDNLGMGQKVGEFSDFSFLASENFDNKVFSKTVDHLGIYHKIDLTTDFTGKLFNEMYGWLRFSQDKLKDVVLYTNKKTKTKGL